MSDVLLEDQEQLSSLLCFLPPARQIVPGSEAKEDNPWRPINPTRTLPNLGEGNFRLSGTFSGTAGCQFLRCDRITALEDGEILIEYRCLHGMNSFNRSPDFGGKLGSAEGGERGHLRLD